MQAPGAARPVAFGVLAAQPGQQRVGLQLRVAEIFGGFHQAGADAVAQFAGGQIGKGHHQNLRRGQRLREAIAVAVVAQHQPYIEQGNGKGFAGTGAGFDQAAAGQRKASGSSWLGEGSCPFQGLQ